MTLKYHIFNIKSFETICDYEYDNIGEVIYTIDIRMLMGEKY